MKINRKIILLSTVLVFAPVNGPIINQLSQVDAVETTAKQGQQLVALGASLNTEQAEQTLKLLGVSNMNVSDIKRVDGPMVDKYIHDGSTNETNVYSSACIEQMPAGYGVQVQIVTPENILNVSQLTYQNAAITAGAKDVLIKVATVNPVTGDGALAGVYELLANSGVAIKDTNVNAAQKEILLVSEIGKKTSMSNTKVNQLVSEIKIYMIENKDSMTEEEFNKFVEEIFTKYGIKIADYPDLLKLINDFSKDFKKIDSNKETINQLEKSITPIWTDELSGLENEMVRDEFKKREKVDFSSNSSIRPEIQALVNRFYSDIESGVLGDSYYSLSYVIETMYPDLTNEEKVALNTLRVEMYYYCTAVNQEMYGQSGVKEAWLNQANNFSNLQQTNPEIAEIFIQIGLKNALMPQVYHYQVVGQNKSKIYVEVIEDNPDRSLTYRYEYDTETGEIKDFIGEEPTPIVPVDYQSILGVPLVDNHIAVAIPVDYKVPENLIVESMFDYPTSDDETTEETTVEDTNEETKEVVPGTIENTDAPVLESTTIIDNGMDTTIE